MRLKSFKFLLIQVLLAALASFANAEPNSAPFDEVAESIVREANRLNVSPESMLEAEVARYLRALQIIPADEPRYRQLYLESQRSLGDAYHYSGHIAELRGNYTAAHEFNTLALEAYRKSKGQRALSSYSDGTEHAIVHIFMDTVEIGLHQERAGDVESAIATLLRAIELSKELKLADKVSTLPELVAYRYDQLQRRSEVHPRLRNALKPACFNVFKWFRSA